MDTSETYIKMSDCPEIQNRTKDNDWTDDDCIAFHEDGKVSRIWRWKRGTLAGGTRNWCEYFTWLPRQDQLQEMVDGDYIEFLSRLHKFAMEDYTTPPSGKVDPAFLHFYSMEQLGIAFVMKVKHNKVWDGKWSMI